MILVWRPDCSCQPPPGRPLPDMVKDDGRGARIIAGAKGIPILLVHAVPVPSCAYCAKPWREVPWSTIPDPPGAWGLNPKERVQ